MTDSVQRLGPYRLLRELGSGGMGRVWLAERDDGAYRQQVAVKVLKRGLDSEEILRRFRNERQILANLSHPNIARLLDGGMTPDGLPYLVLEYVDGLPIDEYCRARRLTLPQTLRLFMAVCAAAHYAHQRLLIHRDIKPVNVLVDAEGVPKLLDFGIAKLLQPGDALQTQQLTLQHTVMLTPRYASPEQIRGEAITTASDVYALGCLLYELLAGQSPYQPVLENSTQLLRAVCLTEPARPSQVAAGDRPWPARALQGDLDNIVLMALRKEPERRYASAEQLRNDLARYLDNEPVAARASTLGYRVTKILRRNPLAAAATLLAAVSLLGATAVSLWQTRIARAERAKAEQRLDDVRRLASTMIFDVDAELENGPTRARGVLVDRALQYLETISRQDSLAPGLRRELAAAYEKIGDIEGNFTVINQLGRSGDALVHYHKALTLREQLLREQPDNRDYLADLAASYQTLGDMTWSAADTRAAHDHYGKAVAILERLVALEPDNIERRIVLARGRTFLANVLYSHSRPSLLQFQPSMAMHRRTAADMRAARDRHRDSVGVRYQLESSLYEMGSKLLGAGQANAARPLLDQAAALTREWLRAEPDNVRAQRTLAIDIKKLAEAAAELGDLPGALALMRESLAMRERLVGTDASNAGWQRDLGVGYFSLGDWLARDGRYREAADYLGRSLTIHQALFAKDGQNLVRRTDVAEAGNRLAAAQVRLGRLDTAAAVLAEVQTVLQTTPAARRSQQIEEHAASNLATQAQLAAARRDFATAARLALQGLAVAERHIADNQFNAYAQRELARQQWRASELLRRCLAGPERARCVGTTTQRCELARAAAMRFQRLVDDERLARDYQGDWAATREAVRKCR